MTADNPNSLKISQNEDGSFSIEWNKDDPQWSFLNNFTSKEIQVFIEEAIRQELLDKQ
jgi:hypothetical protein